jgi:hypothetical protein
MYSMQTGHSSSRRRSLERLSILRVTDYTRYLKEIIRTLIYNKCRNEWQRAGWSGVRIPVRARDFSVFENVLVDYGVNPAFCSMKTGVPSREKDGRGVKLTNLPTLRMKGGIHLLPLCAFMAWRVTILLYCRKLRRKYVFISNIFIFIYKFYSKKFLFFAQRAGFNPKTIRIRCVGKVALGQVSLRVLPFSPVTTIPPLLHAHI